MGPASRTVRFLSPGDLAEILREPVPGRAVRPAGILGILVRVEPKPAATWLREQLDARWREHAAATWWSLLPLDGGRMLVPEPLLVSRGRAPRDLFLLAVDHANPSARLTLAGLFPEHVAELRKERG